MGGQFPKLKNLIQLKFWERKRSVLSSFKTVEPCYEISVIQEAILYSYKELATNLVQFLGPDATVKTLSQRNGDSV